MDVSSREVEYQALRSFLKTLDKSEGYLAESLAEAIKEELTERQRTMVKMYYINQMRMTDIAEELGVSISTVSRTIQRGRNRLRRCLRYGSQALLKTAIDG